ncbi:RidA family protein [Streptomyces sp. NPDC054783]
MSRHIGIYSDAVAIPAGSTQVVLSGTPGVRPDGTRPEHFAEQAGQASDNVCEALWCAGAELSDIVQVGSWLTDRDGIDVYVKVRKDPGDRGHRGCDAFRGQAARVSNMPEGVTVPGASGTRRTPRCLETRSRTVDSAAKLFYVKGVNTTTLDDVRLASSTSKSQLCTTSRANSR